MLEKVILNNFKSFKNQTIIDLSKTNYTILPENVSDHGILKGCIFVGANASGKSNIVLSIKLLLDFLFLERNVNSGMFKCLFSKNMKYSIDYYFLIEGSHIRYYFEMALEKNMICEKLYVDDDLKMERIGTSAKSYIADPSGIVYDENDIDKETLFLRTLYFNTRFTKNPVLKAWMEYLSNSVYINAFERTIISYGKENVGLIKYLKNDGSDKINKFFDEYNFEQNIEYVHSSEGRNVTIMAPGDENEKYIFFKRKGVDEPIPFNEESLGNQNLLRMLPAFLNVISKGGMLLIDEFSSGFHNDLESLLVRYFMVNSKNAQLLFVSHSTNLLTNSLLRPDQEYTVEFHGKEGSSVRRFSTEQPRSAQNIEKMYASGVFGGLPDYKEVEDED
ncbi:MAG: AAA family ATPase [Roseburia sp.]|nr:AAA family ATPase [Roseburia sp.]